MSTTAAKIVFRQNDKDTADRFAAMMPMKITTEKKKVKGPDGKETETKENKEEPVFSAFDLMKLKITVGGKPAEAVILYEGWYQRPIKAEMRMAFSDPKMSEYMKMGRSSPLPEFLIPMHHAILEYNGNPRYYNPQTNELKELAPVVK